MVYLSDCGLFFEVVGCFNWIAAVHSGHTEPFCPLSIQGKFPVKLSDLYDPDSMQLSYEDLLQKSKQLQLCHNSQLTKQIVLKLQLGHRQAAKCGTNFNQGMLLLRE